MSLGLEQLIKVCYFSVATLKFLNDIGFWGFYEHDNDSGSNPAKGNNNNEQLKESGSSTTML